MNRKTTLRIALAAEITFILAVLLFSHLREQQTQIAFWHNVSITAQKALDNGQSVNATGEILTLWNMWCAPKQTSQGFGFFCAVPIGSDDGAYLNCTVAGLNQSAFSGRCEAYGENAYGKRFNDYVLAFNGIVDNAASSLSGSYSVKVIP